MLVEGQARLYIYRCTYRQYEGQYCAIHVIQNFPTSALVGRRNLVEPPGSGNSQVELRRDCTSELVWMKDRQKIIRFTYFVILVRRMVSLEPPWWSPVDGGCWAFFHTRV